MDVPALLRGEIVEPDPVFVIELPLELCPTMNAYAGMKPWMRAKIRKAVDFRIIALKPKFSSWSMGMQKTSSFKSGTIVHRYSGGWRRKAVMTRFSARRPDEISMDVIGGKIPLDRLVHAGVLRDDSHQWLEREAQWVKCKSGEGRCVISIYDLPF